MKIYLIGYMSSGKSTLGKTLANRLQLKFIDTDEAFETKYQISINDFFIKFGEEKFRELEHQLLSSLAKIEDAVISTGGGTPCYYNNIDIINENGISIYLKLHPKSIISRLKASKKQRPLVNDMDNETFESLGLLSATTGKFSITEYRPMKSGSFPEELYILCHSTPKPEGN